MAFISKTRKRGLIVSDSESENDTIPEKKTKKYIISN